MIRLAESGASSGDHAQRPLSGDLGRSHLQDLADLEPTSEELAFGRDWMTNWADGDLLTAADDVIGGLS
jgi:hypothetical protein